MQPSSLPMLRARRVYLSSRNCSSWRTSRRCEVAPNVLTVLTRPAQLKANEAHAKSYALLELFAYRTYEDYMRALDTRDAQLALTRLAENKDAFPPLNAAQTIKLKHLSIVSLASERRVCCPPRLGDSPVH